MGYPPHSRAAREVLLLDYLNMKITTAFAALALLVLALGCQTAHQPVSPPGAGASEPTDGQGSGHGQSGIVDYRQVLADPGWF